MLGNPESLTIGEVLTISLMGLVIVFLCLGALILAIKVLSTIVSNMAQKQAAPAAAPAAAPVQPKFDEESYAVLLSTVSDASGLPLDKFRVVSITEV